MNSRPSEDILYVVKRYEVTFYGNTDRGCRWLQINTENNPHTIQRDYLEDFLQALDANCITHEPSNRVPEL